ncbi:MAG: threonine--tRNA ligase, partial [Deltaproteobacteria bacterium]
MSLLIKLIKGKEEKEKEFNTPLSAKDTLRELGIKDKDIKKVVAVKVNGIPRDLSFQIEESSEIEPIYIDSEEGLEILRHSTAHVMAQAVKRLFPEAKVAIGPAIKDGFYYDFDYERPFREEDLPKIEEEMHKIIQEDYPFIRKEISREEAIRFFESKGEIYKVELLKEISDEKVSIYTQGEFTDLCRGPHIPSTGMIKAFALT